MNHDFAIFHRTIAEYCDADPIATSLEWGHDTDSYAQLGRIGSYRIQSAEPFINQTRGIFVPGFLGCRS